MTHRTLIQEALHKNFTMDSAKPDDAQNAAAFDFHSKNLAISASASVQQWAEEDEGDLGASETFADRLFALLIGIIDEDINGKLTSNQQDEFQYIREYAAQYMRRHGVDTDDVEAILNDWDTDAAERARDVIVSSLPDGDEAADDINQFVFGVKATTLDSATYRPTVAIRDGQKAIVKIRIAGHFTMSPAQKTALKRARLKAKSPAAIRRREHSLALRKKMGIH